MTLKEWADSVGVTIGTEPSVHVVCDARENARQLYRLEDYLVRSKSGPTYWLVPKPAPKKFQVLRDGKPINIEGTHDECFIALHKLSWGCSVDWLCRYEGYAIVPKET